MLGQTCSTTAILALLACLLSENQKGYLLLLGPPAADATAIQCMFGRGLRALEGRSRQFLLCRTYSAGHSLSCSSEYLTLTHWQALASNSVKHSHLRSNAILAAPLLGLKRLEAELLEVTRPPHILNRAGLDSISEKDVACWL